MSFIIKVRHLMVISSIMKIFTSSNIDAFAIALNNQTLYSSEFEHMAVAISQRRLIIKPHVFLSLFVHYQFCGFHLS